jgi:hypothetical protein
MSIPKFSPRNAVLFFVMLAVAILRLISYFYHVGPLTAFTPLGAMALFGGAYFSGNFKAIAFPLLTLFVSDLVLSFTIYDQFRDGGILYAGWYWIYLAFALMTLAGKLIIKHITVGRIAIAVVATTLIHWLVSDIGGCLNQPNSMAIYLQRLATAIPYEWRFFLGTAIYSAIMFGFFELMQARYKTLSVQ